MHHWLGVLAPVPRPKCRPKVARHQGWRFGLGEQCTSANGQDSTILLTANALGQFCLKCASIALELSRPMTGLPSLSKVGVMGTPLPQPISSTSDPRYHPSMQQIAWVETETGECGERRLMHRPEAEQFYRELKGKQVRE